MSVDKPHNGGQWTEARKKSFIISALRKAMPRWGPKSKCISNARVSRGVYNCEICKQDVPATLPPKAGNKLRIKNIIADHTSPIVDPSRGFVDYNQWISRAFVELSGFQAVCHKCHTEKTANERAVATARRANERATRDS